MKRGVFITAIFGMLLVGSAFAQVKEPKITLVKYSDYECPACGYFVSIEHQLKEHFGDDLNIVVKNFPLNSHHYSQLAARAVESARLQDKFQEMHDMVFANQREWSMGNAELIFLGYAQSLGLNMEKFKADINSAATQRIIMDDKKEGRKLGVNSTPTFFINGTMIEKNPSTFEAFKTLIESYMK